MKQNNKRILFISVAILILCMALMIGTTLAWFSSSVSNTGNKVKSGTLNADLMVSQLENGAYSEYVSADSIAEPIFIINNIEPGYSDAVKIKIENNGSLAFRYGFKLVITESFSGLDNAINSAEFDAALFKHLKEKNAYSLLENGIEVYQNGVCIGTLKDVTDNPSLIAGAEGVLYSEDDCPETGMHTIDLGELLFKMPENAGNEFENASIKFDICLNATQYTYEQDGFNSPYYDINAVSESHAVVGTGDTILENDICTVTIPEGSENASPGDVLYLYIEKVNTPYLFNNREYGYQSYRIRVLNQNFAEVSGSDIEIDLLLGMSDNDNAVKNVYLGTENVINDYDYSSDSGSIYFNTDVFGIFTFVIDADAFSDSFYYSEFKTAVENGGTVDVVRDIEFDECIEVSAMLVLNAYDYNIRYDGVLDFENDVVFYIKPENDAVTFNGGNYYAKGCYDEARPYYLFFIDDYCEGDVIFNSLKADVDITVLSLCNEGNTEINNCMFIAENTANEMPAFDFSVGHICMNQSKLVTNNTVDAVSVSGGADFTLNKCKIVSSFGSQHDEELAHSNIILLTDSKVIVNESYLKSISDDCCFNIIARTAEAEIYESELVSDIVFATEGGNASVKMVSGNIMFSRIPENTVFQKYSGRIDIPGSDDVLDVYCNVDLDNYYFNSYPTVAPEKVIRSGFRMEYDSIRKLYKTVR